MSEQLSAGSLFANRFEIERPAGSGGMGTVYRARDRYTGDFVALKLLHEGGISMQDAERFAREARLLSELRHPGIVAYVADGQTPDGRHYLAMEWLEGEDLGSRLARGPLPLSDCFLLLDRVASALAVLHEREIIHRDLKPTNLFLPGNDMAGVKLLDFGIARRTVATRAVTQTGMVLGTPEYMAPEQARGVRELSPAADFFALGCVLYECMTGKPPFMADHFAAVLVRILFDEPAPISTLRPGVPPGLAAIVDKLLKKVPEQRLADLASLRSDLAAVGEIREFGQAETVAHSPPAAQPFSMHEQSLFSVVLAAPSDETLTEPPTPGEDPRMFGNAQAGLREALAALGAAAEFLANGALVVTVPAMASATDQVTLAARAALLIKARWPKAAVALATGRGMVQGRAAVGEVVEHAARLQRTLGTSQSVPTGSWVSMDAVSARLLSGRFVQTPQPFGALLLAEEKEADISRPLLGKPTPCVGRDVELGALDGQLTGSLTESEARAVLITALPGAGKSRLRHEFLRRVAQRGEPLTILQGRADLLAAGTPYAILGQAIRQLCGLRGGESLETQRAHLADRVNQVIHDSTGALISFFLGELCGIHFPELVDPKFANLRGDPRCLQEEICRAFLTWLAAECRQQGLLIVLDDLQWADTLSVGLIDAALHELRDAPLCALAFARPEVRELFPRLWRKHQLLELPLKPLSRKACERLIQQVLGHQAPAEVVTRIAEQSTGNALFLEELIRAIGEGATEQQPDTVLAMLQGRLSRMSSSCRRVALAGSIFGQVFWSGGVAALLDLDQEDLKRSGLNEWLDTLIEAEILVPHAKGPAPSDSGYAFRHALVREAAYSLLTEQGLATGHLLAARYLEGLGDAEPVILAEHFRRGGDLEQSTSWYLRAADAARLLMALSEARQHYASAYALLSKLPQNDTAVRRRIDILLRQVEVGMLSEPFEQTIARLHEAKSAVESLREAAQASRDDLRRSTWVEFLGARLQYYRGEAIAARRVFEQLLPAAETLGDPRFEVILVQSIGSALLAQGAMGSSVVWLGRAFDLPILQGTVYERLRVDSIYAVALVTAGHYRQGMQLADETLAKAMEYQQSAALALVYMNRSAMLTLCEENSLSLVAAQNALAYAQKSGDFNLIVGAYGMLGWIYGLKRRFEESQRHRSLGKQLAAELGGQTVLKEWLNAADADIALRAGDFTSAIAIAAEHAPVFQRAEQFFAHSLAEQAWGLALGYSKPDQQSEADAHLTVALQVMDANELRLPAAALCLRWAQLHKRRGNFEQAELLRAQAVAQYDQAGCSHLIAEVEQMG